jgi:hypothetical protein
MKLLTICPTKSRVGMFKQMYVSWKETKSERTDIIVSLDEDDKQIKEYTVFLLKEGIPFFISLDKTLTEHINNCYHAMPYYDYYHLTNDDVVYHTDGWDKMLVEPISKRPGISFPNDGIQNSNLCTFPVISGEIADAVGWLQQPRLKKLCGDVVWKTIGERADCLFHVPQVNIEHRHWINGKRVQDEQDYQATYQHDLMKQMDWFANDAITDIRKVRKVCNGTASV